MVGLLLKSSDQGPTLLVWPLFFPRAFASFSSIASEVLASVIENEIPGLLGRNKALTVSMTAATEMHLH